MTYSFNAAHRPPISYLFVDANSFMKTVARISALYWPNKQLPAIDWNGVGRGYQKCFFYDAWPSKKPNQTEEEHASDVAIHNEQMDRVSDTPNWHTSAGETRYRKPNRGGATQKMVDVQIAVDMMSHAFNGNMEHVTLFATDLDFRPLLDALVQRGMRVTLWYDPKITPRELRRAADVQQPFRSSDLATMLNPDFLRENPLPSAQQGPYAFNDHLKHLDGKLSDGREWILFKEVYTDDYDLAVNLGRQSGWLKISTPILRNIPISLKERFDIEPPKELLDYVASHLPSEDDPK